MRRLVVLRLAEFQPLSDSDTIVHHKIGKAICSGGWSGSWGSPLKKSNTRSGRPGWPYPIVDDLALFEARLGVALLNKVLDEVLLQGFSFVWTGAGGLTVATATMKLASLDIMSRSLSALMMRFMRDMGKMVVPVSFLPATAAA